MKPKFILSTGLLILVIVSCTNKHKNMERELKAFVTRYDSIVKPLTKERNLPYGKLIQMGKMKIMPELKPYRKNW